MTTAPIPDRPATSAARRAPTLDGKRIGAYLLIALGALLTIAPFYFMFVFATHTRSDIFQLPPPTWFGSNLDENYRSLVERVPFWRNLWNSLYLAVLTTGFTLFSARWPGTPSPCSPSRAARRCSGCCWPPC